MHAMAHIKAYTIKTDALYHHQYNTNAPTCMHPKNSCSQKAKTLIRATYALFDFTFFFFFRLLSLDFLQNALCSFQCILWHLALQYHTARQAVQRLSGASLDGCGCRPQVLQTALDFLSGFIRTFSTRSPDFKTVSDRFLLKS